MNIETIAIVIGVSQYLDKNLTHLPAAQTDAVDFARSIRNWGVPEPNIALFINSEATTNVVNHFLNSLLEKQKLFKFIFYFCGHGCRNKEKTPKSYLLLHDSFISDLNPTNSLSLDSIVEKTNFPQLVENYLFIDACSLRINTLIHPNLSEEIAGKSFEQKNLFCMLSSGIQQSFECTKGNYGFFTDALLKTLAKINKHEGSSSELSNEISLSIKRLSLHPPETYCIGNQKIGFIPKNIPLTIGDNHWIYRHELIEQIQNLQILNRKAVLCLVGKPGIGKSIICKCLSSEKMKVIYSEVPSNESAFNIMTFLTQIIMKHVGVNINNKSPIEIFCQLSEQYPHYTIIIDQSERLNQTDVNKIFELSTKANFKFILSSNQSFADNLIKKYKPLLIDFEIPKMTFNEAYELIRIFKPNYSEDDCELNYIIAQSNPLNLIKITSFSKNTDNINNFNSTNNGYFLDNSPNGINTSKNGPNFSMIHQLIDIILCGNDVRGHVTQSPNSGLMHYK